MGCVDLRSHLRRASASHTEFRVHAEDLSTGKSLLDSIKRTFGVEAGYASNHTGRPLNAILHDVEIAVSEFTGGGFLAALGMTAGCHGKGVSRLYSGREIGCAL